MSMHELKNCFMHSTQVLYQGSGPWKLTVLNQNVSGSLVHLSIKGHSLDAASAVSGAMCWGLTIALLAFECRDNVFDILIPVTRFSGQLVKLATEQKWLIMPPVHDGILSRQHPILECLWRVRGVREGYELC